MPIDANTPAGRWLQRLLKDLADRRDRYDALDSYYCGTNGIPTTATKAVKDAYRRLMRLAKSNFAELIVGVVDERMLFTGFRTGAEGDELGDAEAWAIWQANHLDADQGLVHSTKLALADAYAIVGPGDGFPLITPEDPRQVITAHDPARPRDVVAALKVFYDDIDGVHRAYLYLPPDGQRSASVYRAQRKANEGSMSLPAGLEGWEWDGGDELGIGRVPVVRFANRARIGGGSVGEFELHLPLLDRINYTVLSRLEVATMQAFRQRAIKGNLPVTDDQGNDIDYDDVFSADPGALWQLPAGVEMWESGQVDLGPIRQAIRDDVLDLATVTETPSYRFSPDSATGSAEGASLQREGLVMKTRRNLVQTAECWEQVMSIAFEFQGDVQRAQIRDLEALFLPPEHVSLSEKADAATKYQAAGVPWRTVMTDVLGFSPQQVDRMDVQRMADALLGAPLPDGTAAPASQIDPDAIKSAADAMGVLIRSGVEPEDAARRVGLPGVKFTGAVPVSLRLPEDDAEGLEGGK